MVTLKISGIECAEETISLPEDFEKANQFIHKYHDEIILNVRNENDNYRQYCSELGLSDYRNIGVVDLGYSGSMQYYLSKIIITMDFNTNYSNRVFV